MMGLSAAGNAVLMGGGFGLGTNLQQQVEDESEDEKKKKKLGLPVLQSPAGRMLAGAGVPLGF